MFILVHTCNSPRRSWIEDWLFLMRKKIEPKMRALVHRDKTCLQYGNKTSFCHPPVPLSHRISHLQLEFSALTDLLMLAMAREMIVALSLTTCLQLRTNSSRS